MKKNILLFSYWQSLSKYILYNILCPRCEYLVHMKAIIDHTKSRV